MPREDAIEAPPEPTPSYQSAGLTDPSEGEEARRVEERTIEASAAGTPPSDLRAERHPSVPEAFAGCPDDAEIARFAATAKVRVGVIGCGGAGSNTVHRCVEEGVGGAELCAINTDVAHLLMIRAHRKILLGRRLTKGRGAGARPELGLGAAQESEGELRQFLEGAHIAFVTAGLGGGTGTGSAPVVARIAKEVGALTLGVVTLPFSGEGIIRREVALEGLEELRQICDTTIVIENDRLLKLAPHMSLATAFKTADSVLTSAIKGIAETVTKPGLVNLDFADILTVMRGGGVALIGLGQSGSGIDRATDAVASALASPLLGPVDLTQATRAMVHVMGDSTLTVSEAEKAVALVASKVAKNARILWGCSIDANARERESGVRVLLIVSGVTTADLLGRSPPTVESPHPAPVSVLSASVLPDPGAPPHEIRRPPPGTIIPAVRKGFLPAGWRALRRGFTSRGATDTP